MKEFKPVNSPVSTTDKRLRQAIVLSLALHTPFFMQNRKVEEVVEQRGNIAYVTKEGAKSVLNAHPLEKRQYVEQLKEALENGGHIDLGEFFLKSQYLDGRLEADRMQEALDALALIETKIRTDKSELATLDVLKNVTDREGEYSEPNSYLSTVVLEGKGNCSARERFTSSLVDRLYPDMEIAYQKVKVNGGPHTRTLVKIHGEWRNMEDPKAPALSESDLEGTVLFDKYDYVKYFVGQGGLGTYKEPLTVIDSHTKLSVTDDYLVPPLPDGVVFDNIKDVGSSGLKTSGQTQGFIGSPARVVDGAVNQVELFSGDFVIDSIELEIITPEDVERNRQKTQDVLKHWKSINDAADNATLKMILEPLVPNMRDDCLKIMLPLVRQSAEEVLERCKMDEISGLLSCSVGIDEFVNDAISGELDRIRYPSERPESWAEYNPIPLECTVTKQPCSRHLATDPNESFTSAYFMKLAFTSTLYRAVSPAMGQTDLKASEKTFRLATYFGILQLKDYTRIFDYLHAGRQFIQRDNWDGSLKWVGRVLDMDAPFKLSIASTFADYYCQSGQVEE